MPNINLQGNVSFAVELWSFGPLINPTVPLQRSQFGQRFNSPKDISSLDSNILIYIKF